MRKTLAIAVATLLFAACSETEFAPKHYPYPVMKAVNMSSAGVEFVAEFKTLGDKPVERFGFLWWEGNEAMDSSNYNIREIESQASIGNFSLTVTSDLVGGEKYQVRPFAQNAQKIVLGDIFLFDGVSTNPPLIKDFSPKHGKTGDIITITGSNFSLSKTRIEVFVGTDKGILVSVDANEIVFQLPENLSASGDVPLTLKSGDKLLLAADPFQIEGHVIADFNPKQGIIGETEILITGQGFLEAGNRVRIGEYEATILEESNAAIKIRLPYEMKVGVLPVEVDVNGQVATASDNFTLKSRWVRLADFPGAPRLESFSTLVGNFLYVIGGETGVYSDEVWKYDIANDHWVQLPSFPGGGRSGGVGFAIGTTIYYGLGGGSGGISDFWSFDTLTGEWKQSYSLGSVQGPPLMTTINGVGYMFGGGLSGNFSFTPLSGWTYLGVDPSLSIGLSYDSYFEIGGDRYLLDAIFYSGTGERVFSLYKINLSNPVDWTLVSTLQPFPKKDYNAICFALNSLAYIGEGVTSFEDRKFITLDVTTNQWTQIENFQGPLMVRSGISFSHNNKGYVGFGLVSSNGSNFFSSSQFWMYDPSIE